MKHRIQLSEEEIEYIVKKLRKYWTNEELERKIYLKLLKYCEIKGA